MNETLELDKFDVYIGAAIGAIKCELLYLCDKVGSDPTDVETVQAAIDILDQIYRGFTGRTEIINEQIKQIVYINKKLKSIKEKYSLGEGE